MHELSVTRYIEAPVETVWDVLANRQEEWWCPAPWLVTMVAQERRPGGRSRHQRAGEPQHRQRRGAAKPARRGAQDRRDGPRRRGVPGLFAGQRFDLLRPRGRRDD